MDKRLYNESMIARIRGFFKGLHWKLTLSYTLVTVATLMVILVIAGVGVWFVLANSNLIEIGLTSIVRSFVVPPVASYLDNPEPNVKGLERWLQTAATSEGLSFRSPIYSNVGVTFGDPGQSEILLVLDGNLEYLAGVPKPDVEILTAILDDAGGVLTAALAGGINPDQIAHYSPSQDVTVAVPVVNDDGTNLGVVVLKMTSPLKSLLISLSRFMGVIVIVFTLVAGTIGTIFGYFTARGMTRRLYHIAQATDHWSRGDFTTFIQERSQDELGQSAQRLNRMAEQLQNLLHTRQELATMAERNRLARDLHDGVKQQVFATAMQLGAARALMDQDAKAARKHLDEADQLTRQAQTELAAIIRELHPATLEIRGLAPAIREQIDDWSRHNKIDVVVRIADNGPLPKDVEQCLFRIAQEALSNIARHSQATQVEVELAYDQRNVSLTISDNGIGFDVASVEGTGVGLRSMRERIEALGGDFRVVSKQGQGTRLIARCRANKEKSL